MDHLARGLEVINEVLAEPPSSMRAQVFRDIFIKRAWKGEVPSGPGSSLGVTAIIREKLQSTFQDFIRSLIDAPCGDGTWIFEITRDLDLYLGFDVVPELIAANQQKPLPANHLFRTADISTERLPKADAVLCCRLPRSSPS